MSSSSAKLNDDRAAAKLVVGEVDAVVVAGVVAELTVLVRESSVVCASDVAGDSTLRVGVARPVVVASVDAAEAESKMLWTNCWKKFNDVESASLESGAALAAEAKERTATATVWSEETFILSVGGKERR